MKNDHFRIKLLLWYDQFRRDLPWRNNLSPYHVWISEIILQQTQVKQGTDYYFNFVETFPDVASLALASEEEVLKLWQGLGYYSRALNLHSAAKIIHFNFGGSFPNNSKDLEKLPGIGPYTAAAIASISFNECTAAVDGNAYRVLSRYFDIATPIDTLQGKNEFYCLANMLIDDKRPGDFNQAMMDLGATICKPRLPACHICPLAMSCSSCLNGSWPLRPVKSKKKKPTLRFLYYICIESDSQLILVRRDKNEIWKNLYEFPLIETTERISTEQLSQSPEWQHIWGKTQPTVLELFPAQTHHLTHQRLEIVFLRTALPAENNFPKNFQIIDKKNIFDFPVPKPIEHFICNKIT